jgi:hypothetical protein
MTVQHYTITTNVLSQLLWPWCVSARQYATGPAPGSSNSDDPLIVSAEAAHVAARRHINLVNIPEFITSPPVEQVKGASQVLGHSCGPPDKSENRTAVFEMTHFAHFPR